MTASLVSLAIPPVGPDVLMNPARDHHRKQPSRPLRFVAAVWGIAFVEGWRAVPADRTGYRSGAHAGRQAEVIGEAITLSGLAVRPVTVLLAAMGCLVAAVVFLFPPVD